MVAECRMLLSVATATKMTKVKIGREVSLRQVPKYKQDKQLNERLERSVEYYQNLLEYEMKNQIELRDYQKQISARACEMINEHGFAYLAMEVRTGKTLTTFSICNNLDGVSNVLFITKKKGIRNITADGEKLPGGYKATIVNYESLHKIPDVKWDVIVCDEAHTLGAFPKPSLRAMQVKELINKCNSRVILLSGTPTPESYSQMYHQVYGIPNNPFANYSNFYRFADDYVNKKQRKINSMLVNDYSDGLATIIDAMTPHMIKWSQKDAGFEAVTTEHILYVDMKPSTYKVIDRLKRDLVIEGEKEVILADTAVKLMSKIHQLCGGTVKFESGNSMVIDTTKAEYIKKAFAGKKIGIFYKFKEELNALKQVYGDDMTTELSVFENTDKSIALQIVSGSEAISLRDAECLVYYNIDFSAKNYWQSRDRMTTSETKTNEIYWIFASRGIEERIYDSVSNKKDYTVSHFKNDFPIN
jgi:hypothetical protein